MRRVGKAGGRDASAGVPTMSVSETRWWARRKSAFAHPTIECSPFPWIERVAQAVADQVERQHHQENRQPRPDRHPRRVGEETLRGVEHAAPGWRGRLLAEAEE